MTLLIVAVLVFFAVIVSDHIDIAKENKKINLIFESDATNARKIEQIIDFFSSRGYRVVDRSENQVRILKKKEFSLTWAILCTLAFGVDLLLYILYYLSKSDDIKTFTLPTNPSQIVPAH
jgi:hypothetical protein